MDITETFRPEDLPKTDFFDFVTSDAIGIGIGDRHNMSMSTDSLDPPLQGFDRFWGAEKDAGKLESTIFDDLNRCWNQQNGMGDISNQVCNTDGQIYTLTVLNGNESWAQPPELLNPIKNGASTDLSKAATLDFDSILNTFSGYIRTEFAYDGSGFGSDSKDDTILSHTQHGSMVQQQQQTNSMANSNNSDSSLTATFQNSNNINLSNNNTIIIDNNCNNNNNNNNNDWQMANNNISAVDNNSSAESLLRSALQGKGYTKGLQLQNCIAIIPGSNNMKHDEVVRHLLNGDNQGTISFTEPSLGTPLFKNHQTVLQSTNPVLLSNHQNQGINDPGLISDDMFLALDSEFCEDFEKIKRITSDVQQFCINTDEFSEIISDVAIQPVSLATSSNATQYIEVPASTTNNIINNVTSSRSSPATTKLGKASKKYKRSANNNNNININNNNSPINESDSLHVDPVSGQIHPRKERSLHYCSICSKGFKDKYSVNVHHRTHTGEKPFACSLCGKSFRQKAHLAKHYQTHLAQKNAISTKGGAKQQLRAGHGASQPVVTTQSTSNGDPMMISS